MNIASFHVAIFAELICRQFARVCSCFAVNNHLSLQECLLVREEISGDSENSLHRVSANVYACIQAYVHRDTYASQLKNIYVYM